MKTLLVIFLFGTSALAQNSKSGLTQLQKDYEQYFVNEDMVRMERKDIVHHLILNLPEVLPDGAKMGTCEIEHVSSETDPKNPADAIVSIRFRQGLNRYTTSILQSYFDFFRFGNELAIKTGVDGDESAFTLDFQSKTIDQNYSIRFYARPLTSDGKWSGYHPVICRI